MTADPIRHIVVLMFENHSFDQMLGCFKSVYPGLEGVNPANPGVNRDSSGREYRQSPANNSVVDPDPKHELTHILNQIQDGNGGFVSEYESEYPDTTPEQRQRIMDYFAMGDLPVLHELAKHFTICDHWFSSVPGPTWTNRFFVHSGTSKGLVEMPTGPFDGGHFLGYNQDTIYDRLNERQIPWKIYHGDVPQSLVLTHQREHRNSSRYDWLDRFAHDANGPEPQFPAYAFIEPRYFHIPFERPENDDHPPHSTVPAQSLLADVYNALKSNADLWNSTLLVVLYDEHGGFYDHVPPPEAVPPDGHHEEYRFNQLGVRVPALLISPWVERQVLPTEFDHTSLLRYLSDKWQLQPLTERVQRARSIAEAIRTTDSPRTDTPGVFGHPHLEFRAMAAGANDDQPVPPLNEHQQALLNFSEFLASQTPRSFSERVAMRASPVDSVGQAELARQRVATFLASQKSAAVAVP